MPASVSRLPTRRPSISGASLLDSASQSLARGHHTRADSVPAQRPARPVQNLARRASSVARARQTCSKVRPLLPRRISSAAHLADTSSHAESETASLKRQLARALAQAEEYKHSSSRTALEASTAADKAATQLAEYAARVDQLERHRAVLLAKEREAAERAQARESGESDDKTRLEAEVRALRAEVGQLKDDNADLQESFTDLEHAATQAVAKANDRQKRAELLEAEMLRLRNEADQYLEAASSEKKRRVAVEAELERERSRAKESDDAHVIREELHRASLSP